MEINEVTVRKLLVIRKLFKIMLYSSTRSSFLLSSAIMAAVMAAIHPVQAAAPDLGAASSFGVLGGSTVTNTGATLITGDLGTSPGSAVTGFPPGFVTGSITTGATNPAAQAHSDTITAYNTLAGESATTILTGQDLGGLTLTPGIYFFATSAQLTGTLTLDPLGDPNATFHFQIGTTLTTASLSAVLVAGGLNLPDVFWQVGTSATLGLATAFDGNILAQASITLNTGSGISSGRALAIDGAVTLDTNQISLGRLASVAGTYWKGGTSNLWSQTNWSTDTTGADDVNLPGSGANVIFSETGVLPQNQNTVLDFNANIASLTVNDSVPVTISGANTLTISGAGVFTGITINSGAGLTTIATNLVLAGTSDRITVNNAAGLVISGQIGGSIGLTKAGTGLLTLTGVETYTGATTINAGVLQLGNGVAAGSSIASSNAVTVALDSALSLNLKSGETFSNNVADNGIVAAIQTGVTTVSGDISGSGIFLQTGTGRTILTGRNTYTGATIVGTGTLQVGDGAVVRASISASSPVLVSSGSTLAINLTEGKTFANNVANSGLVTTISSQMNTLSGVISGSGRFHQNGTGITILSGQNTFTGLTRVDRGTLYVDGATGGDALVNNGKLGGSGRILGNVTATNRSTVSAGNPSQPAGQLNVLGNYLQGSRANFVAVLAAPDTNNVLAVSGRSRLNGTLKVNYAAGFEATAGDEFTILTSRRGVTGRFSRFDDTHANTLLTLGVFYLPNSVLLKFVQGSFQTPGDLDLTPNQTAIGGGLDELVLNDPDSPLIAELNRLPLDQLPGAYDRLSPVEFAAIFDSGFAIAKEQSGFIERRLEEIRDNSDTTETPMAVSDGKTTFDAKDGKHMIAPERNVAALAPERRWGFYLNGGAQAVEIGDTSRAAGSDFNIGSANLGADYLLTNHVIVGATVGYSHLSSDGIGDGKVTGDGANGNLYASWFDHGFYVNGILGGGYTSYDTKRESLGGTARGRTEGSDYSALIGTGYEHHIGALTIGPIAALQCTTVSLNGFTEHGSLAPLRIDDQSENSLQSRVGLRASYAWKVGHVVVTPEVRAQWQHEYQDTSRGIGAGFAADSKTSFTVHGPEIGRDSLLLDAGASVQWSPRVSTFAYYTGDLGAKNYSSHSVNAGVRVSF